MNAHAFVSAVALLLSSLNLHVYLDKAPEKATEPLELSCVNETCECTCPEPDECVQLAQSSDGVPLNTVGLCIGSVVLVELARLVYYGSGDITPGGRAVRRQL